MNIQAWILFQSSHFISGHVVHDISSMVLSLDEILTVGRFIMKIITGLYLKLWSLNIFIRKQYWQYPNPCKQTVIWYFLFGECTHFVLWYSLLVTLYKVNMTYLLHQVFRGSWGFKCLHCPTCKNQAQRVSIQLILQYSKSQNIWKKGNFIKSYFGPLFIFIYLFLNSPKDNAHCWSEPIVTATCNFPIQHQIT